MDKYNTIKKCPACGNDSFRDRYECNVSFISNDGEIIKGIGGQNVIIRTCENCNYTIGEIPLNESKS